MNLDWIVQEESTLVDIHGKPRKSYSLKGFEGTYENGSRKSIVSLKEDSARLTIFIPNTLLNSEWTTYLTTTFPKELSQTYNHPRSKYRGSNYYTGDRVRTRPLANGLSFANDTKTPYLKLSQRDFPLEQGPEMVKKFKSIVEHIAPEYFDFNKK